MNRLTCKEKIPIINEEDYFLDFENEGHEIATKLGQLEDIEEELGIDLDIFFKALKEGIWVRGINDANKIVHIRAELYHLEGFRLPWEKRYDKDGNYFGSVKYFSGYGKEWALTKEELLWED